MHRVTPLRLFLVRHGQVAANRDFRYVGMRDDALTPLGVEQARGLAACLAGVGARKLLSSPRLRAQQTASPISDLTGLVCGTEGRLREQSFGRWEGLTRDEVCALGPGEERLLEEFDADSSVAPPGGESSLATQERVVSLIEELPTTPDDGPVILVSHVGPIKAILAAALGLPLPQVRRFFLDPATITVVDWGARPVLHLFNSHSHLGWKNARWLQGS